MKFQHFREKRQFQSDMQKIYNSNDSNIKNSKDSNG